MISFFKKNAKKTGLAAMMVIALPLTMNSEGLRLKAYLDAGRKIPTICWGETENVKLGDVKTKEECDKTLAVRLAYFGQAVDYYITEPMSPKTHAALSSLTYNIGTDKFAKSTLVVLYNQGKKIEACDQLLRWVYAGGKKLNGLVKRRQEERALCLEGLNDNN
jgi:lysozyme